MVEAEKACGMKSCHTDVGNCDNRNCTSTLRKNVRNLFLCWRKVWKGNPDLLSQMTHLNQHGAFLKHDIYWDFCIFETSSVSSNTKNEHDCWKC